MHSSAGHRWIPAVWWVMLSLFSTLHKGNRHAQCKHSNELIIGRKCFIGFCIVTASEYRFLLVKYFCVSLFFIIKCPLNQVNCVTCNLLQNNLHGGEHTYCPQVLPSVAGSRQRHPPIRSSRQWLTFCCVSAVIVWWLFRRFMLLPWRVTQILQLYDGQKEFLRLSVTQEYHREFDR